MRMCSGIRDVIMMEHGTRSGLLPVSAQSVLSVWSPACSGLPGPRPVYTHANAHYRIPCHVPRSAFSAHDLRFKNAFCWRFSSSFTLALDRHRWTFIWNGTKRIQKQHRDRGWYFPLLYGWYFSYLVHSKHKQLDLFRREMTPLRLCRRNSSNHS